MSRSIVGALASFGFGCVFLALLACGGGGAAPGTPPPPQDPFGLEQRTLLAPLGFPGGLPNPSAVDHERAFPNLTFSRPIFLTAAPAPDGSSWIFVAEQIGVIHAFRNDDTVASTSILLDISANNGGPVVAPGSGGQNEEGLLGLAVSPDFATTGELYVHYTAYTPKRSVIARYTATFPQSGAPTANPATQSILLEVNQFEWNHNGGMLAFGPDGFLYMAFGDGGSGNDPQNNGQNANTLLGAMLRIDPRNPPPGQPYAIPIDNPGVGQAGMRGEIWAYGLRHPWRFSFDRNNGDCWLGDVGQGGREEIDLVVRGGNYGWRVYEGDLSNINPDALPPSSFDAPVVSYGRSSGSTVIGGYVYRGQDVPTLAGAYVYADYGSNRVWALVYDGQSVVSNEQIDTISNVASFGEDERGELYAVSLDGRIWRFAEPAGTTPPTFPGLLSETGLFTDLASLTPAAGLVEYDVGSELWSDAAAKRRWIGLPGATQIQFQPQQPWSFPSGTVLVKHFELELEVGNPASRRRLETRVLVNHLSAGWAGYTYRWNALETDAELLPGAAADTFTILDPAAPGGEREQTWTYPSRTDCLQCHTSAAGRVLGVRTEQLNRDFAFPNAVDNQLRSWNHIGLFTTDIGDAAAYAAWPDPNDTLAPLADRARSYLAANCAQCHRPGGPVQGTLDLRFATSVPGMNAVGVAPIHGGLGLNDARIIRSGLREESVLWLRMQNTDSTRMPKLGSALVHSNGLGVVGDWIDGGP